MNDIEACAKARWGTVSGLDPELVNELRRAREAREVRETEALDLDALAAQANSKRGDRRWLKRMAVALGLIATVAGADPSE
tara:strand:+ start:312 stop:554 length:243 start_codon:yes stop_codon:yes gene_type:complete